MLHLTCIRVNWIAKVEQVNISTAVTKSKCCVAWGVNRKISTLHNILFAIHYPAQGKDFRIQQRDPSWLSRCHAKQVALFTMVRRGRLKSIDTFSCCLATHTMFVWTFGAGIDGLKQFKKLKSSATPTLNNIIVKTQKLLHNYNRLHRVYLTFCWMDPATLK